MKNYTILITILYLFMTLPAYSQVFGNQYGGYSNSSEYKQFQYYDNQSGSSQYGNNNQYNNTLYDKKQYSMPSAVHGSREEYRGGKYEAYKSRITEPFSDGGYGSGSFLRRGGIRPPDDPGDQSEQSPVGAPFVLLLFAGLYAARDLRRKN